MDFSLTFEIVLLLFLVAFFASIIDTLAGGGGLLTVPALILSGLPPLLALGTNKFQSSMGTGTASYMMLKSKRIKWSDVKLLMLMAFIGSILGTIAIQFVDTKTLSFVIPAALVIIAIYFLISPVPMETDSEPKMSKGLYQNIIVPAIGLYDGMFGPGTGSFFALAGVSLRGHGLIDATAVAKTLNFATNFASLLVFIIAGKVVWLVGSVMLVGQFLGAQVGSHYLLKIDPKYVRFAVVVMCMAMLAKYMFAS